MRRRKRRGKGGEKRREREGRRPMLPGRAGANWEVRAGRPRKRREDGSGEVVSEP